MAGNAFGRGEGLSLASVGTWANGRNRRYTRPTGAIPARSRPQLTVRQPRTVPWGGPAAGMGGANERDDAVACAL